MSNSNTSDSKFPSEIPIVDVQTFIENTPVGSAICCDLNFVLTSSSYRVKLPTVLLHCNDEHCKRRQRHEADDLYLKKVGQSNEFIVYRCKSCEKEHTIACVAQRIDACIGFIKIGQMPPMGDPLPNSLRRLAKGKSQDWLLSGRECVRQGQGIGALAYYRLVVEETVNSLLDTLLSCCENDKEKDAITQAKQQSRLGDKLRTAQPGIPKNLMLDGSTNPLSLIYSCFSDDLHSDTANDDNAMLKAREGLSIICYLLERIQNEKDLKTQAKQSVKLLAAMKKGQIESVDAS